MVCITFYIIFFLQKTKKGGGLTSKYELQFTKIQTTKLELK